MLCHMYAKINYWNHIYAVYSTIKKWATNLNKVF